MDFKNNIISNVVKEMLLVKTEDLLFDSNMVNTVSDYGYMGAGGTGHSNAGANGDGCTIQIYAGHTQISPVDYVTVNSYGDGGGGFATTSTIDLDELHKMKEEQLEEERLRSKHEALQEAYDNYQLIKKLLEDTESDKYVENRYKDFG